MKTELSSSQKILLAVLLGACVIVGVFFAMKFTIGSSLTTLRDENMQLQTQYEALKMYITDLPTYKKQITSTGKDIEKIVNKYSTKSTIERNIYDYNMVEEELDVLGTSFTYSDPEEIDTITYSIDGKPHKYSLVGTNKAMVYSTGYDNLMEYINVCKVHLANEAITSITISVDNSTNLLTGTINTRKYTIEGEEGRDYAAPSIDIPLGEERIFDSAKTTKDKTKEKKEGK